jgi:hypothetical protein
VAITPQAGQSGATVWSQVRAEDRRCIGPAVESVHFSGLARYFAFYNHARPHQALGYRTPAAVYAMPGPVDLGLSLPAREG